MQKIIHIHVNERILTSEQCGEMLNLTKRIVEAKFRNGEIPAHKKHGKWYVLYSELIEHIKQKEGSDE